MNMISSLANKFGVLLFVAPLLLSSGCAAKARVTGVGNSFLEDVDVSKKLSNMPFNHSWVWTNIDRSEYDGIYVKPIRIDKLP